MKRIFLGADHAGFALKDRLKKIAVRLGMDVTDLSPTFRKGDDYPVAASAVARSVAEHSQALGLLVCGTGHGMEIAANRIRGIRAVVARTAEDAVIAREHNHANILVLGGWITSPAMAEKIFHAFFAAKPSRAVRHLRRVRQLDAPLA